MKRLVPCGFDGTTARRRHRRHGTGDAKHQTVGVGRGRPRSGCEEGCEQRAKSRRCREEASAAKGIRAEKARPRVTAPIACLDPQPRAHQTARDPRLQMIAARGLAPVGLDPRLERRMLRAILAAHRGLRLDQPLGGGGEEIRLQRAVRPLEGEINPVEAVMVGVHVRRLRIQPGIVDLDVEKKVAVGVSRQQSRIQPRLPSAARPARRQVPSPPDSRRAAAGCAAETRRNRRDRRQTAGCHRRRAAPPAAGPTRRVRSSRRRPAATSPGRRAAWSPTPAHIGNPPTAGSGW